MELEIKDSSTSGLRESVDLGDTLWGRQLHPLLPACLPSPSDHGNESYKCCVFQPAPSELASPEGWIYLHVLSYRCRASARGPSTSGEP